MPPQSRGNGLESPSFSNSDSLNPTLKPYLDNLPSPPALSPGRASSTEVEIEDDNPTPMRPQFELNAHDEKDEEDEDGDEDDDEDSLDDDEFESHYSRQESSASSENSDEDEDEDEDEEHSEGASGMQLHSTYRNYPQGDPLHRVSSNPVSLSFSSTSRLHMSHSTTSLPRAAPPIPPPLYPPFYNRPPTPLPPSPSLTSLLRPPSLLNRSTTSTRPTTPDYSDPEDISTPNDTEAAVAHSARHSNPLPPTAPKVPTYEYYGFVLYLASSLAFLIYLLWSYLPSPFLHRVGITYYPNRWWSLAIPAWIVMVLVYIYVALACWNVEYLTLGLQRVETIVDDAGNVAILDENGRVRKGGSKRFEFELDLEEKRKRERILMSGNWAKKGKGGSGKHKRERRHREKKDEQHRFGYMGEVLDGRVANGLTWGQIWNEGTDAVMDIPIGGVCEVLYGDGAEI